MVCAPALFIGKKMITLQEALNENFCYIKPIMINGKIYHAVHDFTGHPVTAFESRDIAFCTARYYDLTPMSVH